NLMGAVAGRLHLERAPASRWADAAALALSMPPWNLMHGFMGSDARILGSAVPVRTALDACDAAEAGLAGATDIIEHRKGFLAKFATVPLPESVTAGLGTRWHTETLSFKARPSGPGTDVAVDCAVDLHAALGPDAQIREVTVRLSLYTLLVEREIAAYLDGPRTRLSALVSSTPYAVATALLTGGLRPDDFVAPLVDAPERWDLARRVRLEHDPEMTSALLASDAPFGEALRQGGACGAAWLKEFGGGGTDLVALLGDPAPPAQDFSASAKATPASVRVVLEDGTSHERSARIPVAGAGWRTRAEQVPVLRAKFAGTGGAPADAAAVLSLDALSAAETERLISSALACAQPASG
ncbi:MmgE/PrpD family protein, partial [Actinocorallia lasiicapitis]